MNVPDAENVHPAVMFEIMADNQAALLKFYQSVFGWKVEMTGGFALIQFPPVTRALFGGIGQAVAGKAGWEKGITFYLEVPAIDETLLERITAHGGTIAVHRTDMGGFVFAMFQDPEQNLVGVMEPITNAVPSR